MSDEYTRRDYAEDDQNTVQATSVSAAANERKVGREYTFDELYELSDNSPGHRDDDEAVSHYCNGSRDSREPQDTADKLAAKFKEFQ